MTKKKDPRFMIMMRFWNGHGFDIIGKDVNTKQQVSTTVLWILKTLRPFQISITDTAGKDPIENPLAISMKEGWIKLKEELGS